MTVPLNLNTIKPSPVISNLTVKSREMGNLFLTQFDTLSRCSILTLLDLSVSSLNLASAPYFLDNEYGLMD